MTQPAEIHYGNIGVQILIRAQKISWGREEQGKLEYMGLDRSQVQTKIMSRWLHRAFEKYPPILTQSRKYFQYFC